MKFIFKIAKGVSKKKNNTKHLNMRVRVFVCELINSVSNRIYDLILLLQQRKFYENILNVN